MVSTHWQAVRSLVSLIMFCAVLLLMPPVQAGATYVATGNVISGTGSPVAGRPVIVRIAWLTGAETHTVTTDSSGVFSYSWYAASSVVNYVTVTVEGATNDVTGGPSRQINWAWGGVRNFGTWTLPGGPPGPSEDVDRDGIYDTEEERLLQKFAPQVRLHPADWNKPAGVDWVLPRSHMNYNHLGWLAFGCNDHDVIAHGRPEYGTQSIYDITNQTHQSASGPPACSHYGGQHSSDSYSPSSREGFFLQQYNSSHSGASSPTDWDVYGHVFPHSNNRVVVQYWFFYPYNDGFAFGNHESDWEFVLFIVEPLNDDNVTDVVYSKHDERTLYDWDEIEKYQGRPVVYAAKGSHANYAGFETLTIPDLGVTVDRCIDSFSILGQRVDYCTDAGVWWNTWDDVNYGGVINVGEAHFPIDADWLRYSGRWGEIGQDHWYIGLPEDATSGKKGPAYQPHSWRYCGSPEICDNGVDDDVDGLVDEAACSTLPDLTLDRLGPVLYSGGVAGPTTVSPGDSIYLQGIVINEGGDSGAGFDVRVALSTDTVYDASDVEIETYSIPAMGQNSVTPLDTCSPVPLPAVPDGAYYLVAEVDSSGVVTEGFAAETNNTAASEFQVEMVSDRLLVENFNDDTANGFMPHAGSWDATGGAYLARGTGSDANDTVSLFPSFEPAVTMAFDVWMGNEGGGTSYYPYFGAILRYESPSRFLRVDTYRGSGGTTLRLLAWDGSYQILGTASVPYDLLDGVHRFVIEDTGAQITVSLDGEERLTGVYSGNVARGQRGLFVNYGTEVLFDNLVVTELQDVDGDGWSLGDGDCDDLDATLNLDDTDGDGFDTCEGDCDDWDPALNLDDVDGDGFSTCAGDCDDSTPSLSPRDRDGDGWSTCEGDCDDGFAYVHPGVDFDDDGWNVCVDCDESNPLVNPGTDLDADGWSVCDGDCDDEDAGLNPADADGDGYATCEADCNDSNPSVHPNRAESCSTPYDDDCDGRTNEGCGRGGKIIPTQG